MREIGRVRLAGEKRVRLFDEKRDPGMVFRGLLAGYKADQIAAMLGIELSTLNRWMEEFPELREARARALAADAEVVQSLHDQAVGYVDAKTGRRKGASVVAAIFWLKARQGWQDDQRLASKRPVAEMSAGDVGALAQEILDQIEARTAGPGRKAGGPALIEEGEGRPGF